MRPLPISVRRLWRLGAIGSGVGLAIVGGVFDVLSHDRLGSPVPSLVVPLLVAVVVSGVGWLMAGLRYRAWRFELTDEWIQARWGVVTQHCATIPRNRVQTMTSENGPVDRLLGLTSVTVHTAGAGAPNLSIPHLDDGTVEWLRGELARGATD